MGREMRRRQRAAAPRRSSPPAQACSRVPAFRLAAGEIFQAESPDGLLCLRPPRQRRARRAARRNRTGGSRCSSRSTPGWREACCRRRGRRSRSPGSACCRRSQRHRSTRSASAATDCRQPWRRCEAARMRRKEAPRRPPESAGRKSRSYARSALRTSAPIRTPPSERSSMRARSGRRLMSTSRLGRETPPFIRSRRLVPAAR